MCIPKREYERRDKEGITLYCNIWNSKQRRRDPILETNQDADRQHKDSTKQPEDSMYDQRITLKKKVQEQELNLLENT